MHFYWNYSPRRRPRWCFWRVRGPDLVLTPWNKLPRKARRAFYAWKAAVRRWSS